LDFYIPYPLFSSPLAPFGYPVYSSRVAGEILLSRDNIATAEACFGLGMVIAKALQSGKPFTVFFNQDGHVELAPYEEVLLDSLEEETAVEQLFERDYQDHQVLAYLAGRRARSGE
jgi:hypothetical protein